MAAILDAVKHPYVPVKEPDRLAYLIHIGGTRQLTEADWREVLGAVSFVEQVTFAVPATGFVEGSDDSDNRYLSFVTPDYFRVLGIRPKEGRFPTSSSEDNAVVISSRFQRAMFRGRQSPIGVLITVNGRPYTIVGVAPAGMEGVTATEAWLPLSSWSGGAPRSRPIVRIRANADSARTRAELDAIGRRLTESHGDARRAVGLRLDTFRPDPQNFRRFHGVLAAAGIIVVLVACGNVANLLLARALDRRPEHALRIALGATTRRVAGHILVESLMLAALGCLAGILLAVWCMNIITVYRPLHLEWLGILDPRLTWRVFVFAALASIAIALAAAFAPAVRIARIDPNDVLKAGAATMTRAARRHDALVIAQLALSLVLLFCAGILARSAVSVSQYEFGYDPTPLAEASVFFPRSSTDPDTADTDSTFRELVVNASRITGVESAAFVGSIGVERGVVTADEHTDSVGVIIKKSVAIVDAAFLRTIRVPIIAGRDFQPGDQEAGAAIVDQEAARKLWRGDSVIGRYLKLGDPRSSRPWIRVVGLIKTARLRLPADPDLPPEPAVFVVRDSLPQVGSIVVRSTNVAASVHALQRLLRERLRLQGRRYYGGAVRWNRDLETAVEARWFMAGLLGVFAGFTLILALAGLYGTLNYSVSRRLREFGIRSALGATEQQIRRLILTQAAIAILAATAIGGPGSMFAARLLESWLYDVSYADVVVLIPTEVTLIGLSFLVCLPVIRRAGRLHPGELLREL